MRAEIVRLSTLVSVALLLGGCEDPLMPDTDEVILTSRADGGSFSLTATPASPTQIDLAWQDNSPNESGFEVHRSQNGLGGPFAAIAGTGANAGSYSDEGLTAEKEYCYKVRAFRTSGRKTTYSAFSNTSCATPPAPPPPPPPPQGPIAPSGANARPPAGNFTHTVEVTWTDNSADEEGFRVERSASQDGPWEAVRAASPNSTLEYIYGQPEEEQLCYRVIAFKGKGESPSNADCTYLPTGPTNLTATAVGTAAVDLAWSDNSVVEDGYDVERSETGYHPFTLVATVPANTDTYRDATVSDNTSYWYRVAAKREGGRSGVLGTASVVVASTAPSAPSEANVTPNGSTAALVQWTDNSSNEVAFEIERSLDGGETWTSAGSATANYPAFFDGGRASEQPLCYRVVASNGSGDSPPSNSDCTNLPKGPTGLVAATIDGFTVDLTWNDNSDVEDGYEVWGWYGGYEDPGELVIQLPASSTTYRDVRTFPYSVYWVVATKDGGYSDWSDGVSPTTGVAQSALPDMMTRAIRLQRRDLPGGR